MLRSLNLSHKISLAILGIVLTTNLVMISAFYFALDRKSSKFFLDSVNNVMKSISSYYQAPVWNLDKKVITEISDAFLKNETIKGIRILDEVDQPLFEKTISTQSFDILWDSKELEFRESKIFYQDKNYLGKVQVLFSDEVFRVQNQTTIFRMIAMVLFFSMLIIYGSYTSLKHLLQNPLRVLLEAIQSANHTRYSVRIKEKFPAELGELVDEFNKVMTLVQSSEQQLQDHNSSLEKMVQERTQELDQKRALIINSSRLAALGEFSAGMAHEINSPLTVISGNARILNSLINKGTLDKSAQPQVQKIADMTARIDKIIKNLRAFARDGKNDIMKEFELSKFIDDISVLTKIKLERNEINFELINESNLKTIYGQEIPLSQVIINIINNAADAVMLLEKKWVQLKIENTQEWIQFTITDSGSGIPREVQEKMMSPFYTTKEVGKGTGLGLSIALGIVKSHKGQLLYNSECPNTQFIIRIPLNLEQEMQKAS